MNRINIKLTQNDYPCVRFYGKNQAMAIRCYSRAFEKRKLFMKCKKTKREYPLAFFLCNVIVVVKYF